MKRRLFFLLTMGLTVAALLLGGCSDFDEMKSQRMLIQAKTLVDQGDLQQAEQVLTELVTRYPNTHAGDTARQHLVRIQARREAQDQQQFAKILGSYQQVLNGYRAVYAEYPRSLSALDASGYFFDAAYLDEIIPEGFQVYLLLAHDGRDYQAWCMAAGQKRGYALGAQDQRLVAFNREEALDEIGARFEVVAQGKRLFALQRTAAPN